MLPSPVGGRQDNLLLLLWWASTSRLEDALILMGLDAGICQYATITVWLVCQCSSIPRSCTQPACPSVISSLEARIMLLAASAGRDWRKSKLYHIRLGATRIETLDDLSPQHSQDSERPSRTAIIIIVDEHSGRGNNNNARQPATSSRGHECSSSRAIPEVCANCAVTQSLLSSSALGCGHSSSLAPQTSPRVLRAESNDPHTRVL